MTMFHPHHRHALGVSFREARLLGQTPPPLATGQPGADVNRAGEDLEREAALSPAQERRRVLERLIIHASVFDSELKPLANNKEYMDQMIGIVQQEGNGGEIVLPPEAQKILKRIKSIEFRYEEEIKRAKLDGEDDLAEYVAEFDTFLKAVEEARVLQEKRTDDYTKVLAALGNPPCAINARHDAVINALTNACPAIWPSIERSIEDFLKDPVTRNFNPASLLTASQKNNIQKYLDDKKLLVSVKLQALENAAKTKPDLGALVRNRDAIFHAIVQVKGAANRGDKKGDIYTALSNLGFDPVVIMPRIAGVCPAGDVNPIQLAEENKLIGILKDAAKLQNIPANVLQDARTELDNRLAQVSVAAFTNNLINFTDRERFNEKFGGSDYETVLNWCIQDSNNRFSFAALRQQLISYAGLSPADAQVAVKAASDALKAIAASKGIAATFKCDDEFCDVPLAPPVAGSPAEVDWKQWKKEWLPQLVLALKTKWDVNPTLISLTNVHVAAQEQLTLGAWVEKCLEDSTNPAREVDTAKLETTINTPPPGRFWGPPWPATIPFIDKATLEGLLGGVAPFTVTPESRKKVLHYIQDALKKDLDDYEKEAVAMQRIDTIIKAKIINQVLPLAGRNTTVPATAFEECRVQLRAAAGYVATLTKEELKEFSGLEEGANLPIHWDPNTMIERICRRRREERLKGLTNDIHASGDWAESSRAYLERGGSVVVSGVQHWGKWIMSLPKNVYGDNEELDDLLKERSALEEVRESLVKLEGAVQISVDKIDGFTARLTDMQERLQKETGDIGGMATDFSTKQRQMADLLRVSHRVIKELELDGLNLNRDPKVRQNAYFIAMTYGIEEAKRYLAAPDAFLAANNAMVNPLYDYNDSVNKSKEDSNKDILQPLTNIGILVDRQASFKLSASLNPATGQPLSVGDTRIDNWLTNPDKSEPALRAILYQAPEMKIGGKTVPQVDVDNFIDAFVRQKDILGPAGNVVVSKMDVNRYVSFLQQHLLRQGEDLQLSLMQLAGKERNNSPLNFFRAGVDAVHGMIKSRDWVEKGLGLALVGGACYAIYSGWKRGGLTKGLIIGVPMFFGADIALKRATGQGLLERLGLTWMNEKDRTSANEEFLRRNGKEERYADFMDSDIGRECVKQLTSPGQPIPVGKLLEWRENIRRNGQDYSALPKGLSLGVGAVMGEMGKLAKYQYKPGEQRQKAYEYLYLTFEALCADVAAANSLGGDTVYNRANLGAQLIRQRYVDFNEPYQVATGFNYADADRTFSFTDVMVLERPTPAMRDALEHSTMLEYFFAKVGIPFQWGIDLFRKGKSVAEIKALWLAQESPELLYQGMKVLSSSKEAFMEWGGRSWFQTATEWNRDWNATWECIKGIGETAHTLLIDKGPDGVEWVLDKTYKVGYWTADRALAAYRELHEHHLSGPVIQGFEALMASLLINVQEIEKAEVADPVKFRDDLVERMKAAGTSTVPNLPAVVDEWMLAMGVNAAAAATPDERLVGFEIIRKSVNAYLLAKRVEDVQANAGIPGWESGILHNIDWPTVMAPVAGFTLPAGTPVDVEQSYRYFWSNCHNIEAMMPFIGQEAALGQKIEDLATDPTVPWYQGWPAAIADPVSSLFLYKNAPDYLRHTIESYRSEMMSEAAALPAAEKQKYERYVNTVLFNVLIESTLMDPAATNRPMHLTVEEAKNFYVTLMKRRGRTPRLQNVRGPLL